MARGSDRAAPEEHREPRFDAAFLGAGALLFAASAWLTIRWSGGMPGGMRMPGGWTMPMAWMRMPGQSWAQASGSFLTMWLVMMVAMMSPSLVPILAGYRRSSRAPAGLRREAHTLLAGAGYFAVWSLVGAAVYPLGLAIAAAEMRSPLLSRSVPVAAGATLVLAGLVQWTGWKARQLEHCRDSSGCGGLPAHDGPGAWRLGVRLGLHCVLCCSGLMAVLLVLGVMDVRAMAVVAAAITAERLAPWPGLVARASGLVAIATGAAWIARATGLV